MRAAVADMWALPHPEERDDPAPSFVSELTVADDRVTFWFDLADCESLMDDVIAFLIVLGTQRCQSTRTARICSH